MGSLAARGTDDVTAPTDDELARVIFDAFCWDVAPGHGSWDDPTMPPDFRLTFIKCAQSVRPFLEAEYERGTNDGFGQAFR
jgi:hypothetical protein